LVVKALEISFSFQFSGNEEFLRRVVVLDAKHIRLAANLTFFDVTLAASRGLVHRSGVPFSTGGALKAGFHYRQSIPEHRTPAEMVCA
jgi:hypothetical protein